MREVLGEIFEGASYYVEQIMYGFFVKAPLALIVTFFTDILFGDIVVLNIYLAFVFADLLLGLIRSVVYYSYSTKYLLSWVLKVCVSLFLVTMVGLLAQSLFRTSGLQFAATNWALFCCTLTESASLIKNLRRLGCPVHPIFLKLMALLRNLAASKMPDNPEFRVMFEEDKRAQKEAMEQLSQGVEDDVAKGTEKA